MKKLSLKLLADTVVSIRKTNKITQAELAKSIGMKTDLS